jgi:DHA1 family inner membrane transport protein
MADEARASEQLPWHALLVLATAMFISQTVEFLPGGLLPSIASELDRSLAVVGQLVTAFAATVVLSAAPAAVLTRALPRRPLLLGALVAISAASAVAAVAPSFGVLLGARVVAGLAHGVFWTVAASYAAYLVPHHLLGRATAITGLGGSLAGILGVPLGNALGQWIGWRAAFGAVAAAGLLVVVVAVRWLPAIAQQTGSRGRRLVGDSTTPAVVAVCGVLFLIVLGPGIFSTYVVPWLNDVAGLPPGAVPLYLLATGVSGSVGLLIVGAFYDRFPRASFAAAGGVAAAALVAMGVVGGAGHPLGTVLVAMVWSAAFGCLPAMLQARVMQRASVGSRPLAAALQTTAINVGFAGGAAAGGLALSAVGLSPLPLIGAGVLAAGVSILATVDLVRGRTVRNGDK